MKPEPARTIHLSQAAIAEINRVTAKHPNPAAFLRVAIKPGGCADFYYSLEVDETIASEDQVVESGGMRLVVDNQSWKYLNGLTLDYSEDLMGGGFRFNNPNASSSCGCGNSFSMDMSSNQ